MVVIDKDFLKRVWHHINHIFFVIPIVAVLLWNRPSEEKQYIITHTAPIEQLASSIATQEGYYAGPNSLPRKNRNPGDLTASPLKRPKDKRGFVIFDSKQEGTAALYHQLTAYAIKGLTIHQMVMLYAPAAAGNDENAYVKSIVGWTGMDPDRKLMDYLTTRDMGLEGPENVIDKTEKTEKTEMR